MVIDFLFRTENEYLYTFIRIIAGIIIFPYGIQKLLGWFDDFGGGVGYKESLASFAEKKVPKMIAWMVILGQSIGSMMLIIGFAGRLAATANFLIYTGAIFFHASEGWTMNWNGKKKGEGIEYFIMLLALLLIIIINGSGAISIDIWLSS